MTFPCAVLTDWSSGTKTPFKYLSFLSNVFTEAKVQSNCRALLLNRVAS